DPEDGRVSYMVPVGRGVMQEYQDPLRDFTCCVGSGMESHALHGDGLYFENDDTVWVNLFAPSKVDLAIAGGTTMTMDTGFPDGETATLAMTSVKTPKAFTLAVRRPGWAGDGFAIKVNGEPMAIPAFATMRVGGAGGRNVGDAVVPPSSFIEVKRMWKSGD